MNSDNVQEMPISNQLIQKQKEYIEFLGRHVSDNAMFLHVHGMTISDEEYQKGVRLRAEIDKLESLHPLEGDGWVSVEDRKPDVIEDKDYSENVFAICDGKLMVMCWCYIECDEDSGYAWCNCYGDINGESEFDSDYKPTHWMPLPKVPKE